jgi:hypothetical protein
MKTLKEFRIQVNEVLKASDPIEKWIDDFVHSKNPKFAGKSTKERIEMAKGAYYAKKNESAAVSQNSTAEVDMREAKEHHLVHVSDGSKYDEVPHEKDIEHVKTGAMHTGGQFDSYSDKGAFFKFKSKEDAEHFRQHVNKAPHKSVDAEHVNEAVEYKGIGTDVVDKKKKLNPQPNFTTDKKQVKDFKEEKDDREYGYEGDMAMSQLKTIIRHSEHLMGMLKPDTDLPEWVQSKITLATDYMQTTHDYLMSEVNEEVEQIDESSLHRKHFQMVADLIRGHESAEKRKELAHHHAELFKKENPRFDHAKFMKAAGVNEEVEQIDELDKKTIGSYAKKATKDLRWQQTMRPFAAKRISNREKGIDRAIDKLTKEEVKKSTGDLKKACWKGYTAVGLKMKDGRKVPNCVPEETELEEGKVYDPITKKMVATKPIKVQAGGGATRNGVPVETGPSKYKQSLKKEEVELIDELSKDTLASYAKKASKDARIKQHVAADFKSKEAHARNPRKKETWGSIAKKYQSKAWKREDGHDKAVDKLAGTKTKPSRPGDIYGKSFTEEVELIQRHEVKADAPHKDGGHVILSKAGKNWHVLHNKKSSPSAGDLHRSKLLHSYDDEKAARAKFKELKEEQIDEVSKSTLMRYIPKASRDVADHVAMAKERQVTMAHATHAGNYDMAKKESGKSQISFKKAMQRLKGIDTATKKLGTQKEEVEQIDELSKGLVARYANKVAKTTQDNYDKSKDKFQFSSGREDGMKNAVKRLTKEEAELDEAIAKKLPVQHAVDAVHATLGPKSATRFLSHLSPGTDKHTSWDKVNDALVKQGVQTHHIASIAQKTSHMNEEVIDESRGHKVLATFFKNREVAQRSYQGNPAKDAEVAQGGGSPADQGIAAAKADYKKMNKENVNPVLMAILKKRQEAQKKKAEDKKKVNEAKTPVVHAAPPKKTKSTAKEYASAIIPGTKRVAGSKSDNNEPGEQIKEDQYTSEYKIKQFVDPITGENKTRKIRPHRINFDASKMRGEPAQADAQGDYGIKEDGKVYDEKWKEYKGKTFKKESSC